MTSRTWITIVTIMVTAAAVAGCTDQSAGSPMPGDTATSTDTNTTTSASAEPTSERPREINLDGKDPCALIPQTDWPQFEIKGPGEPSEDPTFRSPQCYYSGDHAGDITVVVTEGVEAWTDGGRNAEVEVVAPIEGFPTITMANTIDDWACYAAVDVADGQYLMTTATPDPDDPDLPERCDLAYQLAQSAMSTLVAS